MKRSMIFEYLKTISFAILTSVLLSLCICYFSFFGGKAVDLDKPQYLILRIAEHIQVQEDEIAVDTQIFESLEQYHSWMQVLDKEGKVVYSLYTPKEIPTEYTYFDLVNYVIESNRIEGYTLFVNKLSSEQEYSVIIGCSSEVTSKYSLQIEGGRNGLFFQCIAVFFVTSVCVIILAAYLFAKKVTIPMVDVIQDIDAISKGNYIQRERSDNLFSHVFFQLKKLQAALEENENIRAIWISNISHDIKTPLSTIKGYAELMACEEYEFRKDEIVEYAKEIVKSEEVIEDLVEDLKMSQMLVEGKLKLNKTKINVSALLEESMEIAKTTMKAEDGMEICCEKKCEIFGDKKLIKRSLVNIICNAFLHNQQPVMVHISVEETKQTITIKISDNGKGLKQGEFEHIFDRYYRGTNSNVTKGTGLGLAIAKETVLAHGGTIEAKNCMQGGTMFCIQFTKAVSNE